MSPLRLLIVVSLLLFALSVQAQEPPFIDGPGSTLAQKPRAAVPHSPRLPYGLQLMARFDLLPFLRDTKCVQDSSYDRSGGNGDSGNFFRKEGNKAVLADIRGPGCIYRFWSANAAGHLQIFFDGEAKPRIDCPMQDLFLGKVAPFEAPIVGHRSGGWYCFFPMPFAKSCRIEVTDPGSMYYHVEYQLYPDRTNLRTFTTELTRDDQKALATILDQWNHLGDDPKPDASADKDVSDQTTLAADTTKTLTTLKGPGQIDAIHMKIASADRFSLRQTVLRVYWDDAQKPAIEAPVGDFFGAGFGDQRFKALPDAMTDDGYVCYWPMPFGRSARFELANLGKTDLTGVTWSVSYRPLRKPLTDAGYFHAQWHRQTTVAGEHFHILQTAGRGHYVGEHTDMQGDRGIGFLEGDEKMYVDGETFPSIYGTGTEDFYTGGWYFDEGPFNLAYHGCILKQDDMSRVAAYRYQIQDCVPFQHDLKVDIEHGGTNDYPGADYSCVAYWYQDTPTHDWSPIDIAQLTPAHFKLAGVLEAEDLAWDRATARVMDDATLPMEASNGKVAAVLAAPTMADAPAFTFDVRNDDVYTLHLAQVRLPDSPDGLQVAVDPADQNALSHTFAFPPVGLNKDMRLDSAIPVRLMPGSHKVAVLVPAGKTLYLDYVRLEPSRKERGVIEGEALVGKADTGGQGTVADVVGPGAWSGGRALRWTPTASGAALKLPISVGNDGDYVLEMNVDRGPNAPVVTARLDDGAAGPAVDLYVPVDRADTHLMRLAELKDLKQGAHTLTLVYQGKDAAVRQPALTIDYIRLQRSRYPHSLEAENLKVLDAKDGEATRQEMSGFGRDWSGNAQFWFLGTKAGAEATLDLPVQTAGRYTLVVYYTTARDYAIVQALVDGKEVGAPTDTFTEEVRAKGRTVLGALDLTAGDHRLTFRAVGKNPASSSYLIGVDAIGLEPTP